MSGASIRLPTPPAIGKGARYSLALLVPVAIAIVQHTLVPEPGLAPFVLLFLAVTFVAWVAGVGPGLLATAASAAIANYHFVEPFDGFTLQGPGLIATLFFLASASGIALLCGSLREATAAAEERAEILRRHELIVAESRDAILLVRQEDGRILEANQAAQKQYGYTREELLALGVSDLRTPRFRPLLRQQLEEAGARGILFESMHCRKDGTTFPVEVSSRGVTWQGHRVLLSIIRDISERKRVGEELARREALLRQAGKLAHLGAWEIQLENLGDLPSNPLSWSDEVYRIFGFEPGGVEVTNEFFFSRVPHDDRAMISESVARALADRKPYDLEHRIIRADGQERTVHEYAEVCLDEEGRPIALMGAVQDVTDRRLAEDRLRESEADLHRAQAVARTGSWRIRLANDAVVWSDETYRLFGVPPGTPVTYASFLARVHPEDRDRIDASWKAVVHGSPMHFEHRICVGEEVRWVRELGHLETDRHGVVTSAFGTVQDITEQKLAEEKLRNAAAALGRANERLLEADRRKNEFLAMLSHELRNPLAPVRASVYLLKRVPPGHPQATRALDVIDRQVDHMARLVNDLLDVSRISRGKISLQRERLDLVSLLRRAAEDHRPIYARLDVALEATLPAEPVYVSGDPARLTQIAGNLLGNSAKFTPRGGRVTLSLGVDREWAELRVRDTGSGIAPDLLERLFQPFVQADQALDRSMGGLGLGLALVRTLAELHGGTAAAFSDGPGKGSEFLVRLPLEGVPAEAPRDQPGAAT